MSFSISNKILKDNVILLKFVSPVLVALKIDHVTCSQSIKMAHNCITLSFICLAWPNSIYNHLTDNMMESLVHTHMHNGRHNQQQRISGTIIIIEINNDVMWRHVYEGNNYCLNNYSYAFGVGIITNGTRFPRIAASVLRNRLTFKLYNPEVVLQLVISQERRLKILFFIH